MIAATDSTDSVFASREFHGWPSRAAAASDIFMTTASQPTSLIIRQPDDFHAHFRDGAMLRTVINHSARQFARAIAMPNLDPPVRMASDAAAYRQRILDALEPGLDFQPLMTCYLTDTTNADDLMAGHKDGIFTAAKLYPANATTNSQYGVTDIGKLDGVFTAMEKAGLPLLLHGEVTDTAVDIFDREAVYIEQVLIPLRKRHPGLRIVLEHITTADAVAYVEAGDAALAATITPHHLHINRNALFAGGLRPHAYCLPVAKREIHRLALVRAATSGSEKFFLGTDTAPHDIAAKEADCGCAGIFCAPFAMESYAAIFAAEGALHHLEGFASVHGAQFYGLPLNERHIRLEQAPCPVPEHVADGTLKPFHAGETLHWRFAGIV